MNLLQSAVYSVGYDTPADKTPPAVFTAGGDAFILLPAQTD